MEDGALELKFRGLICLSVTGLAMLVPITSPTALADTGQLPDSSSLATPDVAKGVLTDQNGLPVPNSVVTLQAWPANDVMDGVHVGDNLDLTTLAWTKTDLAGNFVLRLKDSTQLTPVTSSLGIVNFEALAFTPTGFAADNFGRLVVQSSGGVILTDPAYTPAPETPVSGLVETAKMAVEPFSNPVSMNATTSMTPGPTSSCSSKLVTDYGVKNAIVGQTSSNTTYINHVFVYTSGASSDLGVAVSASGKAGSWSTGGNHSKSSTSTITFQTQGDNTSMRYRSGWRFGQYKLTCQDCATCVFYTVYQDQTTSFAGGTWYESTGWPGMNKCVPIGPGSGFTKSSNNAYNFTTGYTVSDVVGFNLETKTGFSTTSEITYHNRSGSVTRQLCGNNDYPAGNTAFVVAKT